MHVRFRTALAAVLVSTLATVGLLAGAGPAQAATNFYYVKAQESGTIDGVQASITVSNPYIDTVNDYHTLVQVGINDAAGNTVEVGWMKDLAIYGNNRPHLFTWTVGTSTQCYNGCAYTDNPGNATDAGADLVSQTGTVHSFGVKYSAANSRWEFYYDAGLIGWADHSNWTAASHTFTQGTRGTAFGEVATPRTNPCTDMGNGNLGSGTGPTAISNWQRWDTSSSAWVTGTLGAPSLDPVGMPAGIYDFSNASSTGYTLGGPGWNSIGGTVDNAVGSCAPATAGTPVNTLTLWQQNCPDGSTSGTGCTDGFNTSASCSPAPCLTVNQPAVKTYTTWQNNSTSGKSFSVGRTVACTGTQLTLAPNGSGTAKGVLPAGWDGTNIKCVRRIA